MMIDEDMMIGASCSTGQWHSGPGGAPSRMSTALTSLCPERSVDKMYYELMGEERRATAE
eukprot:2963551-Heterocapsa_arctica.AAC.1